ncbi:hypothetical protein [Sphingomonas sp. PB4P5]|uniref:hypothetical protein n=1 Tax=Parasphingomonas puruogangriensis TaxID=3096155 RepID=UPI002FC7052A
MPRPFNRAQALQNAAFLAELRRTGNVRDAARTLGVHRATFTKRRAKHPPFAADWDAALVIASAILKSPSRVRTSGRSCSRHDLNDAGHRSSDAGLGEGLSSNGAPATANEPRPTRTRSGRLQLRRAQPRRLTRAAEQAFLFALAATANIRLSAAAAGFTHSAFYQRRKHSPAFAREWHLALEQGYGRVEEALLASLTPHAYVDDAWRHNDPPDMPQMTPSQQLQLLYLHQKEARLLAEPPHFKRRRGESSEVYAYRLATMCRARQEQDRQAFLVAEAARAETARSPHEPPAPVLPVLDQVTGWSKASGRAAHDAGRALFGGWRLGDGKNG